MLLFFRSFRYAVPMQIKPISKALETTAWAHLDKIAMPARSLGKLETLAVTIACIQDSLDIVLNKPKLLLAAGDHGIVAQNVTHSPQEITWQQCCNFARGGGVIGTFCKLYDIALEVFDVGVNYDFPPDSGVVSAKIGYGTADFSQTQALSGHQVADAMQKGRDAVREVAATGSTLIIFGEMGVGNTSSASAMLLSLTDLPVTDCVGRGSGLGDAGYRHKCHVIETAVARHGRTDDPIEVLKRYGGYEVAFITGGVLEASAQGMVVLLDGFITTIAAYLAFLVEPACKDYFIATHQSREPGHAWLLKALDLDPILKLDMCLGEGSGAALAYPIIQGAVELFLSATTFEEAHVTDSVAIIKDAEAKGAFL